MTVLELHSSYAMKKSVCMHHRVEQLTPLLLLQKLTSIAKELKAGFVVKAEGVVIQRTKENVRGVSHHDAHSETS